MAGEKTLLDYNPTLTQECLQVLVLLLSGIGEWKDSVVLIGGLTPEILVKRRPPDVPAYVGTADVDLVVDLAVMADPQAYSTFEEVLQKQGFKPLGPEGKPSWRWEYTTSSKTRILLEFLADDPDLKPREIRALPEHGRLAALTVRHADIVFELSETETITADLPGGRGVTKQKVRHANIVGFTVLKILAFRSRGEGKDAHDLVYCLQHGQNTIDEVADGFAKALQGPHREVIAHAVSEMAEAFGDEERIEGYRKDGPTLAAIFEIGAGSPDEDRDRRLVRQREIASLVNALLNAIARRRQS